MSRSRKQGPRLPWWLQAGPDSCEFCFHAYHVEAGYYCFDCDAPVCPLCVVAVRERRVVLCPHCAEGGGD
ncbi:MAG: hypothetical protein RQ736_03385 [Thiogranum sp.]|nr:hypothetical protein [Thiogranum sp.]